MNVHPLDLAQSDAKTAYTRPGAVPILDATRISGDDQPVQRTGLIPLLALTSAVFATVAWNGFLLWEVASFILDWLSP